MVTPIYTSVDLFDNIKHSLDQHYESVRVSAVFECVTTMVKP